jgi:hypothetical protein
MTAVPLSSKHHSKLMQNRFCINRDEKTHPLRASKPSKCGQRRSDRFVAMVTVFIQAVALYVIDITAISRGLY